MMPKLKTNTKQNLSLIPISSESECFSSCFIMKRADERLLV